MATGEETQGQMWWWVAVAQAQMEILSCFSFLSDRRSNPSALRGGGGAAEQGGTGVGQLSRGWEGEWDTGV